MLSAARLALSGLPFALAACGPSASTDSGNPSEPREVASQPGDPRPPDIDPSIAAAPAASPGRTRCHGIDGFLYDADPAGRIVRAGPSPSAAELGRIPPPAEPDLRTSFRFRIIGSENGWLQIDEAGYDEQLGGPAPATAYAGKGWIAGGGVHVIVQSSTGFAFPSHKSPVLFSGYPDAFLEGFQQVRVVGCQGRWILADWPAEHGEKSDTSPWRLRYRPEAIVSRDPVILRAWTAGICNIVETSCDGVSGDFVESSRLDDDY